ncbi:hypothetical protein L2E82_25919 [Cichorium intybus]|uniref:Uncharacterized protein n=1 Tax=Cichorium intybus TaxID=13427 RepID=A0ACB9E4U4_CICIN|nr:hypothetical protein L2E82_25919 [Cichorium intybus]
MVDVMIEYHGTKYTVATNGSGGGQEASSEAFPSNPRERKERAIAKIRTHGQVIRVRQEKRGPLFVQAAYHFQPHGENSDGTPKAPPSPIPTGNYSLSPEEVANKVELISWELRAKTATARGCDATWKGEKHVQSTNLTPASPEGKTQSPTTMDENSQHSAVDCPSPQPEPQRVTENDNVQLGCQILDKLENNSRTVKGAKLIGQDNEVKGSSDANEQTQKAHTLSQELEKQVYLVYANVSPDDILLKKLLDMLAATNPNLKVFYTVDNPSKYWVGGEGYISKDMALKGLPAPSEDTLILVWSTWNDATYIG